MKSKLMYAGALASLVALALSVYQPYSGDAQGIAPAPRGPVLKPKQIQIDLDKAVRISVPALKDDLKPYKFKTPDGKECWALRITGGRPIATPAYWGGMVFIGGGYGSHEFYAFDARTGALKWKVNTGDDGPTAAVVENGLVAFNTESCTVYVLDARTGKVVWQEWLGDPLMSQPAIAGGRLYMCYPAGQSGAHHNTNQQSNVIAQFLFKLKPVISSMSHRLLCADLKTGRHLWEQPLPAEVISAPVFDRGKVYTTCHDGSSWCFDAVRGSVLWTKKAAATSAPVVVAGQMVITQKQSRNNKIYEGIKRVDALKGKETDASLLAASEASYLDADKGGGVALAHSQTQSLDASVGFASAPGAANLISSNEHLGVSSVVGGWAYQGARPVVKDSRIMNAQGTRLNSLPMAGGTGWQADLKGKNVRSDQQVFSPPALGKANIYLCSADGHLLSVNQQNGKVQFLYATEQPMTFQPALADGNMYAGTSNGILFCVNTGSTDADGWSAWGGNAQHNKSD